jgi:uncharacterized protein (TIGR02246 family)
MSREQQNSTAAIIVDVVDRITAAWRSGHPQEMADVLDEDVGMALPGFAGHLVGRKALIDSFATFLREARVHEYRRGEVRVDGSGGVAVAQYPFEMVYEREGDRWRSTGWDVWVFEHRGEKWIAVWRTMQALTEEPASP